MKAVTKKFLNSFQYKFLLLLLILMPFHAFFTTWGGAEFGYRAYWQIWKEVVIAAMGLLTLVLVLRDPKLRHALWDYRPNKLIGLYILLHALLTTVYYQPGFATLLGLKTNLEFLLLFIFAQSATFYNGSNKRLRQIENIILAVGGVVVAFGLAQIFILPTDWLSRFGYTDSTVRPFLLMQNGTQVRILSTLGGPNQLGQYLLIPLAVILKRFSQNNKLRWTYPIYMIPLLLVLFHTFSRSAWIGAIVVGASSLAILMSAKRALLSTAVVAIMLTSSVLLGVMNAPNSIKRNLLPLTNLILHVNSDTDRWGAYVQSLRDIKNHPLGLGPSAAGPASLNTAAPKVNENYYLQLATELGVVGALMFILLTLMLARDMKLLSNKYELAAPLFASLLAISTVNLFLHGWTDSTTAIIWWGAAGALIGGRR